MIVFVAEMAHTYPTTDRSRWGKLGGATSSYTDPWRGASSAREYQQGEGPKWRRSKSTFNAVI